MEIAVGCDTVFLPKFVRIIKRTPEVKNKLFLESELQDAGLMTLAGIFAAKEAIMKALEIESGHWLEIELVRKENGKRKVKFHKIFKKFLSQDLSISHDGNYIFAVSTFLIDDTN
jgi:holo-[acyl-carrier protein] synthase